jgi:hypothetical protein
MAAKDFQELIKAQMETTRALLSAEEAKNYDTIIAEKQFAFDTKNESARKGAETKRVNAAAAASAARKVESEKELAATAAADAEADAETEKVEKENKRVADALEKIKSLTMTSLGISQKQFDARATRSEELKAQSENLRLVREGIEKNGGKAEDNLKFNKENFKLQKAELAERLKNATSKSAKKEIKNEQRALAAKQEGLLGKIAGGINTLRDGAKEKLKSAGKGVMALIKGFVIAGFALALVAFLNSPLWEKTKAYIVDVLVPKLKEFYNAFFGEGGGFIKGIKALFGDKGGIGGIVLGIGSAAALFAAFKFAKLIKAVKGLLGGVGGFAKKLTGIGGKGAAGKKPAFTSIMGKGAGAAKGGAGGAVAKGGGGASKAGKGIANIGKGIGKGLGGILKGIAGGFMAFANPAVALGAAAFALAIVAVGGAVAGAAYLLGKAMPSLSSGFKSFEELDGVKLMEVGKGIGAIGLGLAAFGAGKAIEGVGGLVGSIGGFFGGKDKLTPLEQLKIFSETPINAVQATSNANALVSYSKAIAMAGAGEAAQGAGSFIGGLTGGLVKLFGGDSPLEKLQKFGEMDINARGVMNNSKAVAEYAKAMSILSGDISGADLVNTERANQVNKAGVERSGGGGGSPVVVDAKSTNVVNSNSSSSATFTSTSLQHPNPLIKTLNYAF